MKMNKKLRRILLTVCSAALLVCVTVGATVAYLTSTETVTNTFTVGKVDITLDEAAIKQLSSNCYYLRLNLSATFKVVLLPLPASRPSRSPSKPLRPRKIT